MIDVTCAIIRNDENRVLIVQRGERSCHSFKWEFPGGKIKKGETEEDCIIREVDEELSLDIVICEKMEKVEYDYGYIKVKLIPFICDTLLDLPLLSEHKDYKWVRGSELLSWDFLEADIRVAENYLKFHADMAVSEVNDSEGNIDGEKIKEMLTGHISSDYCDLLAESALDNRDVLNLVIGFSLSNDPTLAFRSSWTLTKAAEKDPETIISWREPLTKALPDLTNESVIRSFLKVINLIEFEQITEEEHGIIAECSFSWLNDTGSAIAVKAYAMEAIYKLTRIYPELADELRSSAAQLMENGSAGLKARGRYIIERMRKDSLGIN